MSKPTEEERRDRRTRRVYVADPSKIKTGERLRFPVSNTVYEKQKDGSLRRVR